MSVLTDPEHISVSKSKGIKIDWKDGSRSEYGLQYLRDQCPCADCTGTHGTPSKKERETANPFQMYQQALKIELVEPVGNYGIKIKWNDGHDAGIYTWVHLRAIAPQRAEHQQ